MDFLPSHIFLIFPVQAEGPKDTRTHRRIAKNEGRTEAAIETRQQTLVRLLRRRFGSVPSELVNVVETTDDVDQLDDWLDHLVTAQTLEELDIRIR